MTTLAELQAKIAELNRQLDKEKERGKMDVLPKIKQHNLTARDLGMDLNIRTKLLSGFLSKDSS